MSGMTRVPPEATDRLGGVYPGRSAGGSFSLGLLGSSVTSLEAVWPCPSSIVYWKCASTGSEVTVARTVCESGATATETPGWSGWPTAVTA